MYNPPHSDEYTQWCSPIKSLYFPSEEGLLSCKPSAKHSTILKRCWSASTRRKALIILRGRSSGDGLRVRTSQTNIVVHALAVIAINIYEELLENIARWHLPRLRLPEMKAFFISGYYFDSGVNGARILLLGFHFSVDT